MPPVQQQPVRPPALRAYALLALSMSLVGLYVGLSPVLVATFPVMLLAWMRFAVAAVAMAGWLRPQPNDERLSRREHGLLFLQSFLGNFLFTLCALYGTALTGALSAGVVMAAIPAAVALLSWAFLAERMNSRIWMAIGCSMLAVVLLAVARTDGAAGAMAAPSWTGWDHGAQTLVGHALLLAAVLCEASYVVIGKRLSGRVSPRRVTAMINLWGLALSTPGAIGLAMAFDFSAVPLTIWALFAFYALSASVFTVWLWMQGLRHVPAQRAGVFTVLLPLSSAAVGVLALGEPAGWSHLAALALAVLAVVLATRPAQMSIEGR